MTTFTWLCPLPLFPHAWCQSCHRHPRHPHPRPLHHPRLPPHPPPGPQLRTVCLWFPLYSIKQKLLVISPQFNLADLGFLSGKMVSHVDLFSLNLFFSEFTSFVSVKRSKTFCAVMWYNSKKSFHMFDYRLKLLQYYNINKSTKNVRTVRIQNSTNFKTTSLHLNICNKILKYCKFKNTGIF